MELSIFLAKVMGFYILIKLVAVWKNHSRLPAIMEGFKNNDPLRFSFGLIMVVLGLLVVLSHNIWVWDFRGVITFIGWAVLVKGTLVSFSGHYLGRMSDFMYKKSTLYVASVISIVLAAILLSKGYSLALF